ERTGSGDSAQVFAKGFPVDRRGLVLNFLVRAEPDGKCAGKKGPARFREDENAAAAVIGIVRDLYQAAALQGLERGCKSRAVHCKQGSNGAHRRRLGAVERHEQGKVTIGEVEWSEFFIKAAPERARSTLH